MFVIVGLGNPTAQYEGTRHNAGFDVIDVLAEKYNISVDARKCCAHSAGKESLRSESTSCKTADLYEFQRGERWGIVNYYKIDPESELLVIYDDISLDVGQLRIRKKGSAGGHNGIKNIIAHLGTTVFPRIKIEGRRKTEELRSGRLCGSVIFLNRKEN